jgi:hypothetical protein
MYDVVNGFCIKDRKEKIENYTIESKKGSFVERRGGLEGSLFNLVTSYFYFSLSQDLWSTCCK